MRRRSGVVVASSFRDRSLRGAFTLRVLESGMLALGSRCGKESQGLVGLGSRFWQRVSGIVALLLDRSDSFVLKFSSDSSVSLLHKFSIASGVSFVHKPAIDSRVSFLHVLGCNSIH